MAKNREVRRVPAGWQSGDAADFLKMDDGERQLLDARVDLARAIRLFRQEKKLSQKDLAARIESTQPRVAKIEAAASDVSFEQLFRTLIALGAKVRISAARPRKRSLVRR